MSLQLLNLLSDPIAKCAELHQTCFTMATFSLHPMMAKCVELHEKRKKKNMSLWSETFTSGQVWVFWKHLGTIGACCASYKQSWVAPANHGTGQRREITSMATPRETGWMKIEDKRDFTGKRNATCWVCCLRGWIKICYQLMVGEVFECFFPFNCIHLLGKQSSLCGANSENLSVRDLCSRWKAKGLLDMDV